MKHVLIGLLFSGIVSRFALYKTSGIDMRTRKGYPFSRRAYKQGLGVLTNGIFGLLGLGAWAAESAARAAESNAYDNSVSDSASKPSEGRSIALASAIIIPLAFLLMHVPFVGEIAFILLFVVFTDAMSEEYPLLKDIGLIKRLLLLLSVWGYSFVTAYMIEDYMDLALLLSLVPVLCLVLSYITGWWQNRKSN